MTTSPLPATEGEVIALVMRAILDAPLKLSPRFERAIEDAAHTAELFDEMADVALGPK